jgi:GAF domain-containing protein
MPLNIDDLAHVVRMATVLQKNEETAQQARHDFDQLEQGIAKMFHPLVESFPLNFTFEQDDLIQGIIDLLADILGVEKASLMLLNAKTGEMRIKAARGLTAYVIQNTVKKVGEGIAGWVAREGKPLLIKDVQRDPQFSESAFYHQYTTRSLICVPLKLGDRVVGVLSANNKNSGEPFNEDDLYLGTIFSHLLLLTLHSAQLHFDRERQFLRETEISNLNRKITATLEPKVLFHLLLNECCSIFQAEFGLIFDLGDRTDECAVYFLNGTRFTETALPFTALRQWASTRSRPNLTVAGNDNGELEFVRQLLQQEVRSWVSAPLVLQDKLTGSLELASFDPTKFKEADKQALSRVGQQAALAVSNARLYLKLLNSVKEISDARKEVERARRGQFL